MFEEFENSFICINKPLQLSSFGVVKKFKYLTKIKKVGHCGTLDPLATGLLILATNKKTKQINELQDLPKTYITEIVVGATTETFDTEKIFKIDANFDYKKHTLKSLQKLIDQKMTGKVSQIPPKYSAIKINGQRAYKLAREDKEFEIQPKQVEIFKFEIQDYEAIEQKGLISRHIETNSNLTEQDFYQNPEFKTKKSMKLIIIKCAIKCSKGTYIRSIANDLAKLIDTNGYLLSLKRTEIGDYKLDSSIKLEDIKNNQ